MVCKSVRREILMMLKAKKAKEAVEAELKAKKAKEAEEVELTVKKEVVVLSSDEDVACFNDVKYTLSDVEIRMFKEGPTTSRTLSRQLASTSTRSKTRSRAPIASTSNAQAASTSTPLGYIRIAMIGYVLGLRAPNDPTALPPSAP
ncbi:hypothetical protein Tco_0476086 [Tanacetum coccineum]